MKKYRIVKINDGLGRILFRVDERRLFWGITVGWDRYLVKEAYRSKWLTFLTIDEAESYGEDLDAKWRNYKIEFVKRINGISDYRIMKRTDSVNIPKYRVDKAIKFLGITISWNKYLDKGEFDSWHVEYSLEDAIGYIEREHKKEENWSAEVVS